MTSSDAQNAVSLLVAVSLASVVVVILYYVWYALALSKLFPKLGAESWRGWVPVLNEMEILVRGGVPGWSVVYYFIPVVSLYGLYLKATAVHRVNEQFGRGIGMTVLGVLLSPVWASILGWGRTPAVAGVGHKRVETMLGGADVASPSVGTGPLAAQPSAAQPSAAQPSAAQPSAVSPPPFTPAPASDPSGYALPVQPAPPAPVVPLAQPPAAAPPVSPAAGMIQNPWAPQPPAAAAPPVVVPPMVVPPTVAPSAVAPPVVPPVDQGPPAPAVSTPPVIASSPVVAGPPVIATPPVVAFPPVVADPPVIAAAPEAAPGFGVPPVSSFGEPFGGSGDDDELDQTVVVDRRPVVPWTLHTDDGFSIALTAPVVVLGRNPSSAEAGVQTVAVPDTTLTLSKTHARLDLADGEWTVTDLSSTNGVIVVGADGTENLIEVGEATPLSSRFVLGKVGMRLSFDAESRA